MGNPKFILVLIGMVLGISSANASRTFTEDFETAPPSNKKQKTSAASLTVEPTSFNDNDLLLFDNALQDIRRKVIDTFPLRIMLDNSLVKRYPERFTEEDKNQKAISIGYPQLEKFLDDLEQYKTGINLTFEILKDDLDRLVRLKEEFKEASEDTTVDNLRQTIQEIYLQYGVSNYSEFREDFMDVQKHINETNYDIAYLTRLKNVAQPHINEKMSFDYILGKLREYPEKRFDTTTAAGKARVQKILAEIYSIEE